LPTPVANLSDLALYAKGLKPEFAADVDVVPNATRYFLKVRLEPGTPPRLDGVARVLFTNTDDISLDELVFRLYPNLPSYGGDMSVDQVIVDDRPAASRLTESNTVLRIPLSPALSPGQRVDVSLHYSVKIPTDDSHGYAVFAYANGIYALAGFYPTLPVFDDAGWHVDLPPAHGDATFTDAAFYQLELTVPQDLTVVTSGTTLASVENGDGTRTWSAVGGPMRDFYVAMSSNYERISQNIGQTTINSYYPAGQEGGGRMALQYASDAFEFFSREFGPYPYAEFDVVPTGTTAGGVEYPGVIAIADWLYAGDDDFFEVAVAHETAHQWWYGLVGSDQIESPWLDEALTNYVMYLYYLEFHDPDQAQDIKHGYFELPYQSMREQDHDRGVAGPVSSFGPSEYGAIVYGKGPLFFDAVRTQLGADTFRAALQNYLNTHRYSLAYPGDLVDSLEQVSGEQIDSLYQFWIIGQGGSNLDANP
jgi:hypothetical protein